MCWIALYIVAGHRAKPSTVWLSSYPFVCCCVWFGVASRATSLWIFPFASRYTPITYPPEKLLSLRLAVSVNLSLSFSAASVGDDTSVTCCTMHKSLVEVCWSFLILQGPGTLFNASLTAVLVKYTFPYDWSWVQCLLFGAIFSATDPVAVVAVLKEVSFLRVLCPHMPLSRFSSLKAAFMTYAWCLATLHLPQMDILNTLHGQCWRHRQRSVNVLGRIVVLRKGKSRYSLYAADGHVKEAEDTGRPWSTAEWWCCLCALQAVSGKPIFFQACWD